MALHFRGTRLERAVSSRARRRAPTASSQPRDGVVGDAAWTSPTSARAPPSGHAASRSRREAVATCSADTRRRAPSAASSSAPHVAHARSGRSSRWAAEASRWSRPTRCSTTSCSSLAAREGAAHPVPADRLRATRPRRSTPSRRASPTAPACPSTCRCSACATRGARSREIVLGQDIVYVGGGSMRNLLAIWRAHGLDELLDRGVARGHRARRPERRRDVLVSGRRDALERSARADRRAWDCSTAR